MKKFCVLGSGSKGNCSFVEHDETRILIDAGLSSKQIELRLRSIGVQPETIDAICITHDHVDHYQGARVFAEKFGAHLYANLETMEEIIGSDESFESVEWNVFDTGESFEIGTIQIESFPISHDAAEPVGFVLELGGTRIGACTDLGFADDSTFAALKDCELILLESNHDPKLLAKCDRPEANKKRIGGRFGHLTNLEAAKFAVRLAKSGKLERLYLGHLSEECNKSQLAKNAFLWEFRKNEIKGIGIYMTQQKKRSVLWADGKKSVSSVEVSGNSMKRKEMKSGEKAEIPDDEIPENSEKSLFQSIWDWVFDWSDEEEDV